MPNYYFCVDDDSFHREKAVKVVEAACAIKGVSDYEIIQCCDGNDLLSKMSDKTPKLITLDINMPNMDGLTALIRVKTQSAGTSVVMASSEDETVISRLTKTHHSDVEDEKKQALLQKVISRVRSGVEEPGKINSVLEAAAQLKMDPIAIAKANGAADFLKKPYNVDEAAQAISYYI